MKQHFHASQFKPTQYDTAEVKARQANLLIDFLESGCPLRKFTKALYHTCYQHLFGHIAHFDRAGFYATWFSMPRDIIRFIDHALAFPYLSSDPTCTWADVERELVRYFRNHPELRARYQQAYESGVEQRERAELARLKEKYE